MDLRDSLFNRRNITIQELKQVIVDKAAVINEGLQRRVYYKFQKHLQECIAVNGCHLFELCT